MLRDLLRAPKYYLKAQRKTVSDSQLRYQMAWIAGIALDFLSYLIHEHVYIFDFIAIVRPPHGLEQFSVRNRHVRVSRQVIKEIEFLRPKPDILAANGDMTADSGRCEWGVPINSE